MVPFLDLSRAAVADRAALHAALDEVLDSGWVLLGPQLEAFEHEFAVYTGHAHCVAVSTGAWAIALGLQAMGIGAGDEVVVPSFTAVPTAAAVCAIGALPVMADVDLDTATLDPVSAEAAVTERTRAIVPVHLYGRPAAIPELGVPVLEDAAQAHGAVEPGPRPVAYSFYPTKNLGSLGDGGAVVTDDEALAREIRLLRTHGAVGGYRHERVAMSARLSELSAAVLRHRLRALDDGNERRRTIAARYREAAPWVAWQKEHPRHVHHLCVGRVADRDAFRAVLPFESAVHYPLAVHQQPAYRHFRANAPQAEVWAAQCVSFPCHPFLRDDEVDAVSEALAALDPTDWTP